MEHYQYLIIKGLINGGGSSSETYVSALLTGRVTDKSRAVSEMWRYLDVPLKKQLVEIFDEVCSVQLNDLNEKQIIRTLIEYIAKKAGNRVFFESVDKRDIDRMSDEEYTKAVDKEVMIFRDMLIKKER